MPPAIERNVAETQPLQVDRGQRRCARRFGSTTTIGTFACATSAGSV
jgi:hypothetical protein